MTIGRVRFYALQDRVKGDFVHSKEIVMHDEVLYTEHSSRAYLRAARIAAFAAFAALGAQVSARIPITPVPFTLQTLFVAMAGITLGARDGFFAMLVYIACGAAGAPIFAGFSSGLWAILGHTGG